MLNIISRGLLLVLFISYYSNITFFSHAHIVNGVTIVHSHFCENFGRTQPSQHEHTTADIQLIAAISQLNAVAPPLQSSIENLLPQSFVNKASSLLVSPYLADYEGDHQLRAPPYFNFFQLILL